MIARCGHLLCGLALAFVPGCAREQAEPAAAQAKVESGAAEPAWSEPVNGLEVRIEMAPRKRMHGTLLIASRLELRNTQPGRRAIRLNWSRQSMTYRLLDAAAKPISMYRGAAGMASGMERNSVIDLVIPPEGTLSFDITGSTASFGFDQLALLDLGLGKHWNLEKNDVPCWLHAVLEIPPPADHAGQEAEDRAEVEALPLWYGRIELPPAVVPTEGPKLDPARAGKWIVQWGTTMTHAAGYDGEVQEAAQKLSMVDDPRAIGWYLKALRRGNRILMLGALDQLARFDGDEAFEGVKIGLAVRPADITDGDPAGRGEAAKQVRVDAVDALSRSSHPEARPLLFSLWNDPVDDVRLRLVHNLGWINTPESTALLRKMANDPNSDVRTQADVYLEHR